MKKTIHTMWSISKNKIILVLLLMILPLSGNLKANDKYNERLEKYKTGWERLIPRYTKLQFAGSMGLLSIGTGWEYGKRKQWETDVFFGWVPKYNTSKNKLTFTFKQNFMPWNIPLGNKGFSTDPLTCGAYINTVYGNDFWAKEPGRYPNHYYNFSTKMRFNIFVGQRITYKIPQQKRKFANALTLFYEISTCDLYLVSAVQNKYLKPIDYLGLSLGLKVQIL